MVHGTVVDAGVAVQNAELYLSNPLTHKTAMVHTDGNGRFAVGPLRMWRRSMWLLGDPLYAYSLSIRTAAREYPGVSAAGVGFAPKEIGIRCDLSKPVSARGTLGYCVRDASDVDP
jgi:hypothetical protein